MQNWFSRRRSHKAFVLALGLCGTPFAVNAACTGNNVLDRLQTSDPIAYADITAAADAIPNSEGIFWRIDVPGAAPSYLFGTKHTADRAIDAELALAQDALRDARLLLVELGPPEMADMAQSMQTDPTIFMDMSGGVLAENLPPELISRATEIFAQYGIPHQAADRIEPWFLQMAMSLPPCAVAAQQTNPAQVLDIAISTMAADLGVEVRSLEEWENQLKVFSDMSAHDAKAGLTYMIETFENRRDDHETMSDLYGNRQIGLVWAFSLWRLMTTDYDFETTAEAHIAELERALLIDRNIAMADKAAPEVAKGGVVIAVGALHMIGESGLVAAFQRRGYTVTRLE